MRKLIIMITVVALLVCMAVPTFAATVREEIVIIPEQVVYYETNAKGTFARLTLSESNALELGALYGVYVDGVYDESVCTGGTVSQYLESFDSSGLPPGFWVGCGSNGTSFSFNHSDSDLESSVVKLVKIVETSVPDETEPVVTDPTEPEITPSAPILPDDSGDSSGLDLDSVVTTESLMGILNEIISLLPVLIPVMIAFIGIRKVLAYLTDVLHSA